MKKFSLGKKHTYTQIRLNILNKLSCSKVYCHYTTSSYINLLWEKISLENKTQNKKKIFEIWFSIISF